jgi:hypothetical protein
MGACGYGRGFMRLRSWLKKVRIISDIVLATRLILNRFIGFN